VTETVFLGSGIFVAFLNRHDQWHTQATALFSLARPRWSTSYLVIGEAYSWFLHRFGEEAARSFRGFADKLDGPVDGLSPESQGRGSGASPLVPPVRISATFGRPIHPGRLRCSSVTYVKYAPSSRLADRAPRPPKHVRSSDRRH